MRPHGSSQIFRRVHVGRKVLTISNRHLYSFFSGELGALACRALGLNSGAGCSPSTTATTICGLWLAIVCEPLGGFSASVRRVLVICKSCSPFLCSDIFAGAPQRRLHWQGGRTGGKEQTEGASQAPPRQDLLLEIFHRSGDCRSLLHKQKEIKG